MVNLAGPSPASARSAKPLRALKGTIKVSEQSRSELSKTKLKRRIEEIEKSIQRYLVDLNAADRQEDEVSVGLDIGLSTTNVGNLKTHAMQQLQLYS